jgi:hypothetical protein
MTSAQDSESGQPVTVGDAATTAQTPAEEAAATALTLANTLSEVLASVSEKLADLEDYGKQNRKNIVDLKTYSKRYSHVLIGLAISLALDISLSIVTILLGLGLAQQNSTQHASLIAACHASNITRAQDQAAWNILLEIPSTLTITDPAAQREQKKLVAELKESVTAKDAPVDCVKRYGR